MSTPKMPSSAPGSRKLEAVPSKEEVAPPEESHDSKMFRLMAEATAKINELHQVSPLFARIMITNIYGSLHGTPVAWSHEFQQAQPAEAATSQV